MKRSSAATAILIAVVVSVLLAALVATGQDQNTNTNSNTTQNTNTTSNMSGSNKNTSMLSSSDQKFVMEAATNGMEEVELGKLAAERGSTDAVKQFGQRMVDDHTKANEELMRIASSKGLTPPTALDDKQRGDITKLSQLSGAEFDRAYMKEAGVKDHNKAVKLFQNEADKGKDADLKAFAAKTLPTIQEHLRMAEGMEAGMRGDKNTKGQRVDSGAGTHGESQGSGVDTNPSKRTTQNSNMSNSNMSDNSNTMNSNMSNSNMSNTNMSDNSNMSGNTNTMNSNMSNSNMSGNDNTSGNSNMSGNDNTMNANGNSNTGNANGNSNTGNTNGNSNNPR